MQAASPGRDPRIDFLRGVCLLTIYTRHINTHLNIFRDLNPSGLGFSDAAEAFVFLSGLVCGKAYTKALGRGFLACQLKATWRCLQIYLAHILTLLLNLALIPFFFDMDQSVEAQLFYHEPAEGLAQICCLASFPYGYSILAFYVLFLLSLPTILWLSRKLGRGSLVLLSFNLYCLVQFFPEVLGLPDAWTALLFNPLAWQLLFCAGVTLGSQPDCHSSWLPRGRVCLGMLLAALSFLAYLRYSGPAEVWQWAGKANLEPLRLIHFLVLAYLCWLLLPGRGAFYQSRLALPLIRCGQNSLLVFCFGVFLTNVANESLAVLGRSPWWQLAANIGGWSALLVFAALLDQARNGLAAPVTAMACPVAVEHSCPLTCRDSGPRQLYPENWILN